MNPITKFNIQGLTPQIRYRLLTIDSRLLTMDCSFDSSLITGFCHRPNELNKLHEPLPRAIPEDETISRGRSTGPNEPRTTNHELTRKAGSIGHLGCFSFFPTKNLGGYGDGGMVITDDDELAERVRKLRVHGSGTKYHHQMVGYNSRLDALQAAVLSAKLPYLDKWSDARAENADYYTEALSQVEDIIPPTVVDGRSHIYHQYTIRVKNGLRDKLQDYLEKKNIGTKIYYPLPLHLQKCFQDLDYDKGDFPNSERASKEALSLPIFPELTKAEMDYVIQGIKEFMS